MYTECFTNLLARRFENADAIQRSLKIRTGPIFESETTLVNFALHYLKAIAADLTDEDLTTLTESTGKTPQWILGHLRVVAEFGSQALGSDPNCGSDWFEAYGPGSQPGAVDAPAFTVADVLNDIEKGYARLLELSKAAPEEVLNENHGFTPLEPQLVSKRDLMSHLLSTHIMYHLSLIHI